MGKTCVQSLIHLHTFTQCDITGLSRLSGKFHRSDCSKRQKRSKIYCPNYKIHRKSLLCWMRKSMEAARVAIPKEKCTDPNGAIILN